MNKLIQEIENLFSEDEIEDRFSRVTKRLEILYGQSEHIDKKIQRLEKQYNAILNKKKRLQESGDLGD